MDILAFKIGPLFALMRCPPVVFSPSLSPFLCSVCLFFEERKIRDNKLEGKVPASTVSTPSGFRTHPRTSESGGALSRAFGHVQIVSILFWFAA